MLIAGENNRKAIVSHDGSYITYGGIEDLSAIFAELKVRNSLVLVITDNSLSSVSSIASLIEMSAIPVLFNTKSEDTNLIEIVKTYNIPYIFGPIDRVQRLGFSNPVYTDEREYGLFAVELTRDLVIPNSSLAILLTTSGSTGNPKLVRISDANLIANADAIVDYLGLTESERPFLHLPVSYTYGLSILTSHLRVGATVFCTDESIVSREFWNFLKESSCTSLPGVPFTYSMLKRLRFTQMDLPELRTLTQAGGKLSQELQKEFGEWASENNRRFYVMYGQTEATARMSYLPSSRVLEKIGSIGIPIPGGSFQIVDDEGEVVADAQTVGNLIYKGPNVALGYAMNDTDLASSDVFKGRLATGDLAYRDNDDFFYLSGRKDRYIKMYGNRINLDDIEKLVSDLNGQAACVGIEDLITIFLYGEHDLNETIIKQKLTKATNINSKGFRVVVLDQVPLNMNEKIDYRKLAELAGYTSGL